MSEEIAINVLSNLNKEYSFRSSFTNKKCRSKLKDIDSLISITNHYLRRNKIPKSFIQTLKKLNDYYINNWMSQEDRIKYSSSFFELQSRNIILYDK